MPRRGGATRSLRTQAQSPSNTPLRSISQWGRARGRCSKVNRRQRPRARSEMTWAGLEGLGQFSACALGAGRLSEALPACRGVLQFVAALRAPHCGLGPSWEAGWRQWPRKRRGLAAAEISTKKFTGLLLSTEPSWHILILQFEAQRLPL